ncbi:MAG: hypothetical protein LBH28_12280 [Oscillospiraceae bacterium]|jgi:hypothetical protein|nr:hypothetical protein [Oscillospiraceae bacterium]
MKKTKPRLREILTSAVFVAFIGVFFVLNIVVAPPKVLVAERRIPAKFPEFKLETILSGSFMSKFDDYAADSFVFRDTFRGVHAFMVFDLYRQGDKSGLYRSKEIGLGEFRRTNEAAFRQSAQKVCKAAQSLDGLSLNIYYSLIPDKSIFAKNYMPGFDLDLAETILSDELGNYPYIRIADKISASDFYKTDLHWNQREIANIASFILSSMGASPGSGQYAEAAAGEFLGLYAGQLALPVKPDILSYADVPGLRVNYLNEKTLQFESGPVYDVERFSGVDPYDVFLRGPQPIVVLENESAPKRELFLFRDSFGSSLAPLLAASYSKVTLIDLRYINLMLLDQFVVFPPDSDVLFIYGSQIFNNPSVLQT